MQRRTGIIIAMVGILIIISAAGVMAQEVLTAWHVGTTKAEKEIVNQAIERFEADNPNYQIKVNAMNDDAYKTKLQVAASGGGLPDLFITWGGGPLKEYVKGGVVHNITPKLKEAGIYNKLPDSAKNLVGYNGDLWGFPVYGVSAVAIWYNQDLFDEYNVEVPETWTDLKSVVKQFRENDIIPIALANETKWPGTEWYEYLVYRIGGVEPFEKAKVNSDEVSFEDEVFIKAAEMLQELVKMDGFVNGFNALSYGKGESRGLVYTEKAAMELMGNWWYTASLSEAPEFVKSKIDFMPFPVVEEGKGNPSTILGSAGGGSCWSIAESSNNKDAAFNFLTYLADEETTKAALEGGELPILEGRGEYIQNPMNQKIYDLYVNAAFVQNYWDQELPPQIGEKYKTLSQQLLGLDITPEEFTSRLEQAVENFYSE